MSSFFLKSVKNKLQAETSHNFNVKEFLSNEDLDDLPEINQRMVDQELESFGWQSTNLRRLKI